MVVAQECIDAIKFALAEFGRYNYYDKGAEEVMEVRPFASKFRNMSAKDAADVLVEVANHEHGSKFVSSVLNYLQDAPDAFFDELMSREELSDLY